MNLLTFVTSKKTTTEGSQCSIVKSVKVVRHRASGNRGSVAAAKKPLF
jgi:hypothetical protein